MIELELEFLTPDAHLILANVSHGILGHPRKFYDTMLQLNRDAVRRENFTPDYDPYQLVGQPFIVIPDPITAATEYVTIPIKANRWTLMNLLLISELIHRRRLRSRRKKTRMKLIGILHCGSPKKRLSNRLISISRRSQRALSMQRTNLLKWKLEKSRLIMPRLLTNIYDHENDHKTRHFVFIVRNANSTIDLVDRGVVNRFAGRARSCIWCFPFSSRVASTKQLNVYYLANAI